MLKSAAPRPSGLRQLAQIGTRGDKVDDDDDGLVVALGFGSVPTGADDDDEGN